MLTVYEFKNLNTEGNYLFQYVRGRKLSDIYHTHDFYEIIILIRGECTKVINEEEVELKKDSVVFLVPGDRHVFKSQSKDVCVASLSVNRDEFNLIHGVLKNTKALETSVISIPDVYSKFCSMIGGFTDNLSENDCKLFLLCLLNGSASKANGASGELVRAAKEMEKPENLKRGIDAFTRLSSYSRSHLARLMKKHYGMTVHEFILDLRLSSAYRLITLTSTPMEEIAESIGYESFSHFNQIFKKKYGVTPAALRRSNKSWTV